MDVPEPHRTDSEEYVFVVQVHLVFVLLFCLSPSSGALDKIVQLPGWPA
jgi:hypothetical protein